MEYELVEILGLIRNKIGKDEKFYSTKEGDLPDKPEYKVVGVMPIPYGKKRIFVFAESRKTISVTSRETAKRNAGSPR